MSNPTFVQGPITFEATSRIEKFTLVSLNADGKVVPAGASGSVFGVVTEIADPAITTKPTNIAVHYGTAAVKLRFCFVYMLSTFVLLKHQYHIIL